MIRDYTSGRLASHDNVTATLPGNMKAKVCSAWTASAPETRGNLGMTRHFKSRQEWLARSLQRKFLEVERGGLT